MYRSITVPLPTLLVASGNPGKLREYRQLLGDIPYNLTSLNDFDITEEVEETGETFAENSLLKSTTYARLSATLTLSDDSGLEVDALNGEPGVHTARYGGDPNASDLDRVHLLLRNLEGVPWERRTARFRCFLSITDPTRSLREGSNSLLLVGSVAGMIQYQPEGGEGFGYDPVFYLPSYGKTIAQLPLEEKNWMSHRGDAARKAVTALKRLAT
jgi:XTP/dITP diphosphohydrolase